MPSAVRATILQPDPTVPVDRLGPWLGGNRILIKAVPLWKRPVPALDDLGDGVVILGGQMSAHDQDRHEWITPLKRLMVDLAEAEVPTLAICLGHQLLAEAFGGSVTVADPAGGEVGVHEITWLDAAHSDPMLARLATGHTARMYEHHHDAVTELPKDAELLASSQLYPNQAFRIGSILGVQFHPEASPELMGRWTELGGGDGRQSRRSLQKVDGEVARNGRLLAQAFSGQLRARAMAA